MTSLLRQAAGRYATSGSELPRANVAAALSALAEPARSRGHWLMDGLDPDRRDVLLHLVPAPARIIIVKGYARRYRAACARRWGPGVNVAPQPVAA